MSAALARSRAPGPIAGALIVVVLGAALLAPLLTYPFGRDQGVFATVADIIAQGGVPYRDAWEMKPPGVFYLYRAGFALFGRSALSPRLLDVLWTLAAALAIFALGRRLLSPWAGAAGALLFVVRYAAGHSFWNTAQCESFASLPTALAALALIAAERRRSAAFSLACGALIGAAVLIKFTLGIIILLPLIAAAVAAKEPRAPRLARAACSLLGCAAVLGVSAALLWRAGALREMIEITLVWNARYAQLPVPFPQAQSFAYQSFRFLAGLPHLWLFPVGLLALVGTGDLALRPAAGRTRWLVPAWALLMVAAVWIQGKYYTYHWLPVLPPLALLAAQGLRGIWAALARAASRATCRALAAVGIACLCAALALAYWATLRVPIRHLIGQMPREEFLARFDRYGDVSLQANRAVASFLRAHTEPDDPIFIWGFEPLIYWLADRPPASRFIYTVPLVVDWSPDAWRPELISDLTREQPRFLVVAHNDALPWMTGRADDSAAQLRGFPELEALIARHYRRAHTIEDFDIYRREQRTGGGGRSADES